MLVSAATVLPVTTLSFEARPNGKNIGLSWSTSMEINNKGFVIERSTDGSHFETIGWKDGALNSSRTLYYSYVDNFVQPNQLYYYRLRQTDIDSRENLSEIRQARISNKSELTVSISPNPASNQVNIFTAGTVGLSDINLLDAKGQIVQRWNKINCSLAPQALDISKIAAGVYLIQVITGEVISTNKLIVN
ncbi:MAG: T9SS type A sorting domain-containing protein [Chitinophagaceae bacterium]|nr:MAG: T9SS type A sorting domain-containing protein [Chitinophagaceae bacterium]